MIKPRLQLYRLMISLLLFASITSFAKNSARLNESDPQMIEKAVQITVAELPVFFSPYAQKPLAQQYRHLFFDSLLRWDEKGELEGRLLASWQEVKPGVIRLKLKKGIYFHSGNPLTSRDITWTYNESIKKQHSFSFLQQIQSVTAIDEYNFEIHSSLEEAQVLDYLTLFFVLDSQFYKQHKIDQNAQLKILRAPILAMPISGTGPYLIKEYNPALHLKVEANKNYWQEIPSVSELRFVRVKSAKSRLFALLINDVDISTNIPSNNIASVDIMTSKSLVEINSENVILLTINDKKSPIFAHEEARSALLLAINQQEKVKTITKGMGKVEHAFIPVKKHHAVLMNSQLADYDIKKSKQIIRNLQLPNQLTLLTIKDETGNKRQIINALISMMKKVGIQLVHTEVQTLEEWNKHQSDYDLSISIWKSYFRNSNNMYNDLFNDSYLSGFINSLAERKKINYSLTQQAMFLDAAQREHYVTPLFFQNNVWAADNKFNLADIFSVTGVPYWQELKINNITY